MLAALALGACSHPQLLVPSPGPPEHLLAGDGPVPAAPSPPAAAAEQPAAHPGGGGPAVVPEAPEDAAGTGLAASPPSVWGVAGLRAFATGEQVAPNGLEYRPLFAMNFSFNLWLWRPAGVYLFSDSSFWGQRATPGVTNPSQGVFDFSKREFDFDGGVAWNYAGALEARAFAYSSNNLNRGTSTFAPKGYDDGVGLEQRLYLGPAYADLGTAAFDVARATFVSVGYYPTKDMVDGNGSYFKPGPFLRAYLTYDLRGETCYLYADLTGLGRRSFTPESLSADAGMALRPLPRVPRLEFRLGTADTYYPSLNEMETGVYGEVRWVY
jgi:hypothetical protein